MKTKVSYIEQSSRSYEDERKYNNSKNPNKIFPNTFHWITTRTNYSFLVSQIQELHRNSLLLDPKEKQLYPER
ncbi:hypothetical protein LEP1GSC086_3644 [Leptospira weilii str. LNT 1234]|nr:hypothetical protein LEP1GSC086_3644 [Leptospira weilii str. LNT 1234]